MRTVRTKVYKFNELRKDAKQVAIDKNRDINLDYEWWECDGLLDVHQNEWIEKYGMKEEGNCLFSYKQIFFSLDQNRSLKFDNLVCNDDAVMFHALGISDELAAKIDYVFSDDGSRYPDSIIEFSEMENDYEFTEDERQILDNAESTFSEWVKDAWLSLQKWSEDLATDERIAETLESNEYEFTKEGNIF